MWPYCSNDSEICLDMVLHCVGSMQETFKDVLGYTWIYMSLVATLSMYFEFIFFVSSTVGDVNMPRKFGECLWPSNSTVYFIAGSCLFNILGNVPDWHLQSIWMFLRHFCNSRLPLLPSIYTFYFLQITFRKHDHKWKSNRPTIVVKALHSQSRGHVFKTTECRVSINIAILIFLHFAIQ